MANSSLRPCLKHQQPPAPSPFPFATCSSQHQQPPAPSPFPFATCSSLAPQRVHFPPSPALASTHLTHAANDYDRAPIVVMPNACALPARNDRTYTPCDDHPRKRAPRPSHTPHFPPAYPATPRAHDPFPPTALPPLVPDLSSESDESDTTPPSAPLLAPISLRLPSSAHAPKPRPSDLAFLPHPPSPEQERGRKRSPVRARGHRSSARRSEFAAPELEGCLGGF
ncbi:hypothetical protein FA95DRAFT_1601041 [Auriscalpium vulgare]|uniref:Uncharacterized protein n=1 Tax=Auriscalpium vulgare TaxID=40419 RepID=A0ACB8SB73_9AGAM|nr:hypothetical protein FA95DRAFT_1601041 [Auriscalpium vulgare]